MNSSLNSCKYPKHLNSVVVTKQSQTMGIAAAVTGRNNIQNAEAANAMRCFLILSISCLFQHLAESDLPRKSGLLST